MILIDQTIFVALLDRHHPDHQEALDLFEKARRKQEILGTSWECIGLAREELKKSCGAKAVEGFDNLVEKLEKEKDFIFISSSYTQMKWASDKLPSMPGWKLSSVKLLAIEETDPKTKVYSIYPRLNNEVDFFGALPWPIAKREIEELATSLLRRPELTRLVEDLKKKRSF